VVECCPAVGLCDDVSFVSFRDRFHYQLPPRHPPHIHTHTHWKGDFPYQRKIVVFSFFFLFFFFFALLLWLLFHKMCHPHLTASILFFPFTRTITHTHGLNPICFVFFVSIEKVKRRARDIIIITHPGENGSKRMKKERIFQWKKT